MFYILSLLLSLLICTVQSKSIGDWLITHSGEITKERQDYDCNVMAKLCSEKNCYQIANKLKTLPTESIYKNDGEPKEDIKPTNYNQATLLCVSSNFFSVRTEMSGIINFKGSLDFVAITPQNAGSWKVNIMEIERNDYIEKEKRIMEQEGAQISQHSPCKQTQTICDRNLKSCIEDVTEYPYLTVDINKSKFNQIATCDDNGKIEGSQCREVVCTPKGGNDDDNKGRASNKAIPAIISCDSGNKVHPIYYHITSDRWCLSQYESHPEGGGGGDRESMTLKQSLLKQVVNKDEVEYILQHEYDPKVQSYWFWGDAFKALHTVLTEKEYKQIQQHGLLNWQLTFDKLYPPNYQDTFKKLRRCEFNEQVDINKNCRGKTVIPWDLLQLAVIKGIIKSASTQNINVEKNSAIKPDDIIRKELIENEKKEENVNSRNSSTSMIIILSILIPIFLILFHGLYILHT